MNMYLFPQLEIFSAKLKDFFSKLKDFFPKLKDSENPVTFVAAKWLKKGCLNVAIQRNKQGRVSSCDPYFSNSRNARYTTTEKCSGSHPSLETTRLNVCLTPLSWLMSWGVGWSAGVIKLSAAKRGWSNRRSALPGFAKIKVVSWKRFQPNSWSLRRH